MSRHNFQFETRFPGCRFSVADRRVASHRDVNETRTWRYEAGRCREAKLGWTDSGYATRKVIEVSWTSAFVLSPATRNRFQRTPCVWWTARRLTKKTVILRKAENPCHTRARMWTANATTLKMLSTFAVNFPFLAINRLTYYILNEISDEIKCNFLRRRIKLEVR